MTVTEASDSGPEENSAEELAGPVMLRIDISHAPEPVPAVRPRRPAAGVVDTARWLRGPPLSSHAPVPEPIVVRLAGHEVEVPDGEDAEGLSPLGELVLAAYLFGGWARLEQYRWQLSWIALALRDPETCAHRLRSGQVPRREVEAMAGRRGAAELLPPSDALPASREDWAVRLTRYLAAAAGAASAGAPNPSRVAAAGERAIALHRALGVEADALRPRILAELQRVELSAQRQAKLQVTASRALILSEGWRLLGVREGKTFEEWTEDRTVHRLLQGPPTAAAAELNAVMTGLAPAADAVSQARLALLLEVMKGGAAALVAGGTKGTLRPTSAASPYVDMLAELLVVPRSKKVEELNRRLGAAREVLARALAPAAARFPILLRYTPSDIVDALHVSPHAFHHGLHRRLALALASADAMLRLFNREQPLQSVTASAAVAPGRVAAPETAWAADVDKTVWAYPKALLAGVDALYLTPDSLGHAAVREMIAAVDLARASDERVRTGIATLATSLVIGLAFVCPPGAVAVDAAYGITDAVVEEDVYQTRSEEYFCAIDPADAFAEVEPSMLPLVIAVAGVLVAPL